MNGLIDRRSEKGDGEDSKMIGGTRRRFERPILTALTKIIMEIGTAADRASGVDECMIW